jgi:hypothetical protein
LDFHKADSEGCSVCRDLLVNLGRFFDMLETARRSQQSDWLTVEDIAKELKVSKSIVYRLIRKGEIEAVDIVDTDGEIAKKGHYRIKRSSLDRYLEVRQVKPFPGQSPRSHSIRLPKVKNRLGS